MNDVFSPVPTAGARARLGRLGLASVLAAVVLGMLLAGLVPATADASDDPAWSRQWNMTRIRAADAWPLSTGAGVLVGIVDTGVDLAHEDLAGRVVAHTSCVGSGGDPARCAGSGQDDQGHGTHVAGIVAAVKDNGKGVAGVAPDARLVVAKALDKEGSGTTEDINAAIRWVVDNGAQVVNLSLGGNFLITSLLGTSLEDGIRYAWSRGAVPVLASGNTNLLGLGSSQYGDIPAIVVGATGPDDRVAHYSSPTGNAQWAVLAPGGAGGGTITGNVLSTWWRAGGSDEYKALAGTSMAAPHVAGVAALLMARGETGAAAVARILASADSKVPCGANSPTCRGRLDAGAALDPAAGPAPPEAGDDPEPLLVLPRLLSGGVPLLSRR